ncbi:MAG: tripartite tricarboxylate transporter TctB family protein [bacterium]|nr:tripartite tricarboxylate transporter TctB family protein [bacterium]
MKSADRITATLLLVLSGLWIYWARQLPYPKFAQISKMSPGDFPIIIAVMLAVFAVWLFVDTFHDPLKKTDLDSDHETKNTKNPKAMRDIVTGFGIFTAMLVVMPFIGFSLAAIVFVCTFLLVIGSYKYYLAVPIAVLIPSFLWLIFGYLLAVPLPKGPWGF